MPRLDSIYYHMQLHCTNSYQKIDNKHRRTTAGSVSLLCYTTPRSTLVSWLAARPDTEEDLENGRRISGCPDTQHSTLQTYTLPNQPTPCGSRPEFTAARPPHSYTALMKAVSEDHIDAQRQQKLYISLAVEHCYDVIYDCNTIRQ